MKDVLHKMPHASKRDLHSRPAWQVTDLKLLLIEVGSPLREGRGVTFSNRMREDMWRVVSKGVDIFEQSALWQELHGPFRREQNVCEIYYQWAPTVAHFYEKVTAHKESRLAMLGDRRDPETLALRSEQLDWYRRTLSYAPQIYGWKQVGLYTGRISLPDEIQVNGCPFLPIVHDGGPSLTR